MGLLSNNVCSCWVCLIFLLVIDEESTIEEQEIMEREADHKAELVDLAKDGAYFTPLCKQKYIHASIKYLTN